MRYRFLVPSLLILLTLAVFWPVNSFEFVTWDDGLHVYENQYLNPPNIGNTLHFWKEAHEGLYIPLTYTAWAALAWLSQHMPADPYGLNPRLFHIANLTVHILNTLVVFSILRMLLSHGFKESENADGITDPSKVEIAAVLGALIFALHPVQVESVVWITGMKDLLCGLFSFLAIREYLAFAFASKGAGGAGTAGRKNLHYILACAAFLLALLSKPTAVIVPLAALILDRWAVKRPLKESATALVGWFMVALVFAIATRTIQESGAVMVAVPLWARPFIAGDALAFYLYKLIFPLELGIDYGRGPDYVLEQWWGYVTWLVPFSLAAGTLILKRRGPILVSMGIFTAALLPVLGILSFTFQNHSTVADRYLYMPMLGVAMAASSVFLHQKTKYVAAIFGLIIVLLAARSSIQERTWRDNAALYNNAIKVNSTSGFMHFNMGTLLANEKKWDAAVYHLKKGIELQPWNAKIHDNLGVALASQGKLDEAIGHFNKALSIRPDYELARQNLGIALEEKRRFNEALTRIPKR